MNLNIGLLIPRSESYPLLPQYLVKAIKLAFNSKNIEAQFTIEDIGKGGVVEDVISKANSLLLNDVDLCFAMVGDNSFAGITNLFSQSGVPLFLLNSGEKINYSQEYKPSSTTFINSLGLWQSLFALGEFCAKEYPSIVSSSSFFETGFQFLAAFGKGLEKKGGKLEGYHSTQNFAEEDFKQKLASLIGETKPKALLCLYHGNDADEFYSKCIVKGYDGGLPIVTTPLGLGTGNIELDSITLGATWFADMSNEENKTFVEAYTKKNKKTPELFAALAYEAASVAANTVVGMDSWDADEFCESIKNTSHKGIRGAFTYTETGENSYLPTYIKQPSGEFLEFDIKNSIKEIKDWQKEQLSSGWLNPYPCS